jgi:hypothetical protein
MNRANSITSLKRRGQNHQVKKIGAKSTLALEARARTKENPDFL